jgi:hypothetical protein
MAIVAGTIAVLLAAPASAQYVFLGGGLGIPAGEFKDDGAKSGWLATAGVGMDIGSKGLWAELQAYLGNNKYEGDGDDKLRTLQGMVALGYSFMREKSVSPWVTAGRGCSTTTTTPARPVGKPAARPSLPGRPEPDWDSP